MDVLIEKLKDNHRDIDPIDSDQNDDIKTKDNLITDNATIVEKLNDDDDQNTQQEMTEAELKVQEQLQQLQDDHDLWSDPNPFGEEDIMNSTRMNEAESQLDIQLSPVRSLRARLEALKQKAIKELPEPTNLQERYRLRDIRFKLNHQVSDERDESSVGRLREKYVLFSQLQREEEAKKNRNLTTQLDPVDKSTCKLITLKKTLKVKMVEKRRQEYEKRLKLYKMENENELEEEEVDGENDDDNDANSLEEEEKEYEENGEDFGSQDDKLHDDVTLKEKPNKMNDLFEDIEVNKNDDDETGDVDIQSLCGANVRFNESCPLPISSYLNQNPDDKLEELMDDCKSQMTTSQDIMDLCSGKMKKSLALLVESEDEENDADDDNEKMSQENVIRRQRYNFDDSDDEMNDFALELNQKLKRKQNLIEDDEESADGLKRSREDGDQEDDSQESTGQVRRMNELDEEANQDDEERDEEYGNGEFVKKSRWRLNDFIEDQAELSEEDADAVSSDEDEGGENEYEQEEINEDLPSDEEILAQNNKIFWYVFENVFVGKFF